jgi:hypothetical protein
VNVSIAFAAIVALSVSSTADADVSAGKLDVADLCSAVATQTLEYEPFHPTVLYQYQNIIYLAAGVSLSDSQDDINAKVRQTLNQNMPQLLCNQVNFTPRNGNILKLAVARQAGPFIDDVIYRWKPNLNQIDVTDGRTVLDYIANRNSGLDPNSGFSKTLLLYYERFRAVGAKTRAELNQEP